MADIMPTLQADATRVETAAQTAVLGAATQVQGIALTGFADAHAYAQHIASLAKSDVQRVETSHTAIAIVSLVVGVLLGSLATYALMALGH